MSGLTIRGMEGSDCDDLLEGNVEGVLMLS